MLTINGANFVNGASVLWNGTPLSGVTVINSGSLTVPVPANQLVVSYTASVVVSNPGGGNSNAAMLAINASTPGTLTLSPGNANALSGGFELQISAANLLYNTYVIWNYNQANQVVLNTQLTTPPATTGGAGTLTAVVTNSMISTPGAEVAVAVVNTNADGTTLISQAGFAVEAEAVNNHACLLSGARNYAFLASGPDANGAASMIGSFRIDDSGAVISAQPNPIVNSYVDFKDPKNLFAADTAQALGKVTGAGGSCADITNVPGVGMVNFTVTGIANDTFTLNYTLRAAGNGGRVILTDTRFGIRAAGQIQIQNSTSAFTVGSYAFGLIGETAAASRYAVVGSLCTPPQMQFLQADFADSTTGGSTVEDSAAGWSLNPGDATMGRATTSPITFSHGRKLTLTLYGVTGRKAFAMDSTPLASSSQVLSGVVTGLKGNRCLPTGSGGSFTNASLTSSIFGASSEPASSAGLGLVHDIAPADGGSCPAGQRGAKLELDINRAGVGGALAAAPACFTVSPSGRTAFTFMLNNKQSGGVFYLDGPGNYLNGTGSGYLIGEGKDIEFGFVQPQSTAAPLPNFFGDFGVSQFNITPVLLGLNGPGVTSVALAFKSSTSGTITDNTPGGSCTAPAVACAYTVDDTTGRGTATLNTATTFGDTSIVFYELDNTQLYFMDQIAAAPVIGTLVR
jgi:hypothetical protein